MDNNLSSDPWFSLPNLSDRELNAFRSLIYEKCGITVLNSSKKTMLRGEA